MRKRHSSTTNFSQLISDNGVVIETGKRRKHVVLSLMESGLKIKWFRMLKEIFKTGQHRLVVEMSEDQAKSFIRSLELLIKSNDDCHKP